MKKILYLTKYDNKGASSRLRSLQYVPLLRSDNYHVDVSPFFDDRYLDVLYTKKKKSIVSSLFAYVRRFRILLVAKRYDLVVVEKELFPFAPGFMESSLFLLNVPYVVDYDDAIFHNYDLNKSAIVKFFLKNKLDPLLRGAACVTVGNRYLADYVQSHGAGKVMLVPTTVDVCKYTYAPPAASKELKIGWIGSPSTYHYLQNLRSVFERLKPLVSLRIITIGAPVIDDYPIPITQYEWTEESEVRLLSQFDVGIMPICDEPWERGKCGYKLIQYMASGRPVIASAVGVNANIVNNDVGVLAVSDDDWFNAILWFNENRHMLEIMGSAGRRQVEFEYSVQSQYPRLRSLFDAIIARKH